MKLVTKKGQRLRELGLDVKNLNFCHDQILLKGQLVATLTLAENNETAEYHEIQEKNPQERVKRLNTQIGRLVESLGYRVKPINTCHDYVFVNGTATAYITRKGSREVFNSFRLDGHGGMLEDLMEAFTI